MSGSEREVNQTITHAPPALRPPRRSKTSPSPPSRSRRRCRPRSAASSHCRVRLLGLRRCRAAGRGHPHSPLGPPRPTPCSAGQRQRPADGAGAGHGGLPNQPAPCSHAAGGGGARAGGAGGGAGAGRRRRGQHPAPPPAAVRCGAGSGAQRGQPVCAGGRGCGHRRRRGRGGGAGGPGRTGAARGGARGGKAQAAVGEPGARAVPCRRQRRPQVRPGRSRAGCASCLQRKPAAGLPCVPLATSSARPPTAARSALCALCGFEAAGEDEADCRRNFLHFKNLREAAALHKQLARTLEAQQARQPAGAGVPALAAAGLAGGGPLPPPPPALQQALRQALAAGWADQVARRIRSIDYLRGQEQQVRGTARGGLSPGQDRLG